MNIINTRFFYNIPFFVNLFSVSILIRILYIILLVGNKRFHGWNMKLIFDYRHQLECASIQNTQLTV